MQVKRILLTAILSSTPGLLKAQFDFHLGGRNVQVHSFASQGFMYTNTNNYMTTDTSRGSFAFTDFGVNASTSITDRFRVGAQLYNRNVGHLGNWQPALDWAVADYKFKDWLGIRGGKVKTTLGLYNDTQDMEFLHTWALMPQSVYSLDQRGSMISHYGADVYGNLDFKRMGGVSYAVYGGKKPQDLTGGFVYALETSRFVAVNQNGLPYLAPSTPATERRIDSYGGTVMGADLRWNTPVTGWMVGASYVIQDTSADGIYPANGKAVMFRTVKDNTTAYYVQYARGNFRFDGEYRRQINPSQLTSTPGVLGSTILKDMRMGYVAATYRLNKLLEVGSYHSRFVAFDNLPHSDPLNHIFDTTLTVRVDLRDYLDLKVEGHFVDGVMPNTAISRGFYAAPNPQGLSPNTRLLVVRLGYHL